MENPNAPTPEAGNLPGAVETNQGTEEKVSISKAEYEKTLKTAGLYKDIEAQRNRMQSTISKIISTGVVTLDDSGQVIVHKQEATQPLSPIDKMENELVKLKRDYSEGNIDQEAYDDRRIDLRSNIAAEKKKQEFIQEQTIRNSQDREKATASNYHTKLVDEFPTIRDSESPLIKEMARMVSEDPGTWGQAEKNIVETYKLAKLAATHLRASGIEVQKQKETQKNERITGYGNLNSGDYAMPDSGQQGQVFSPKDNEIFLRTGLTQDDIKRLSASNPHLATHRTTSYTNMPVMRVQMP